MKKTMVMAMMSIMMFAGTGTMNAATANANYNAAGYYAKDARRVALDKEQKRFRRAMTAEMNYHEKKMRRLSKYDYRGIQNEMNRHEDAIRRETRRHEMEVERITRSYGMNYGHGNVYGNGNNNRDIKRSFGK